MDYKELQDILSTLDYTAYKLESLYVENEGEVTDETELLEGQVEAMKTLLNGEGVDFLGRWLKGKEDKKKAIKAEKDYLTRQMEAIDKTRGDGRHGMREGEGEPRLFVRHHRLHDYLGGQGPFKRVVRPSFVGGVS